MTALTLIMGVIMILCGISCLFTPVATFLSTGYLVGFLFLLYGISGLIRAFQRRSTVLEVILHIISIAIGVFSLTRPGGTEIFDRIILLIVSAWFLIQGIITIVISLRLKGLRLRWFLGFIMGILGIVLGVYSLIHPLISALTVGYLIAIYFIESGLDMIVLAFTTDAIKKEIKKAKEEAEVVIDTEETDTEEI